MLETISTTHLLAQAAAPIAPAAILVLCVAAGIGTVMLLPSRREASTRKIGGVVLLAAGLILAALLVRWTASSTRGGMGVYFWVFSAIAIFGAVRVVTHTKPVYSALYFVLTVFASAGLFLLVQAEFMAAALILIYAGAILITYVFVIMLAAESVNATATVVAEHDAVSRDPLVAAAVGFALMGVILFVVFDRSQNITSVPGEISNVPGMDGPTQLLGEYLFKNQLINLELAGLILTVAMVGAIVIARRRIVDESVAGAEFDETGEVVLGPATPIDDNPHSIPVYGTTNPRQKAYPET
jgi:NADH-quinone oxidoreductase subunit J